MAHLSLLPPPEQVDALRRTLCLRPAQRELLAMRQVADVIGIDLGITNIAAESDGTIYSGRTVRYRLRRRNRLQKKGALASSWLASDVSRQW
ncbi:MAG: hypothetical protein HGA19_18750 [Oscillochloris sp.]|nr:hypothetical protein [Oscillochloris sp.]